MSEFLRDGMKFLWKYYSLVQHSKNCRILCKQAVILCLNWARFYRVLKINLFLNSALALQNRSLNLGYEFMALFQLIFLSQPVPQLMFSAEQFQLHFNWIIKISAQNINTSIQISMIGVKASLLLAALVGLGLSEQNEDNHPNLIHQAPLINQVVDAFKTRKGEPLSGENSQRGHQMQAIQQVPALSNKNGYYYSNPPVRFQNYVQDPDQLQLTAVVTSSLQPQLIQPPFSDPETQIVSLPAPVTVPRSPPSSAPEDKQKQTASSPILGQSNPDSIEVEKNSHLTSLYTVTGADLVSVVYPILNKASDLKDEQEKAPSQDDEQKDSSADFPEYVPQVYSTPVYRPSGLATPTHTVPVYASSMIGRTGFHVSLTGYPVPPADTKHFGGHLRTQGKMDAGQQRHK